MAADGTILYCNSHLAHLLKTSLQSLIGFPLTRFLPVSQRTSLRSLLEHGKKPGTRKELLFTCDDGTTVTVLVAVSAWDQDGVQGISLVATDLTERKEAEEQLRRAHDELEERVRERTADLLRTNAVLQSEMAERKRAQVLLQSQAAHLDQLVHERTAKLEETVADLENFSYSITHDMRAPLRAIQSFASLLDQECGVCASPQARDFFTRIQTAASRMDKLIQDSLDYAKILREDLELVPVDVGQLLRDMISSYPDLQLAEGQIKIEFNELRLLGNVAGLTQCFSNLLRNAVKFVAPGVTPKIRVWNETSGRNTVRLWIEDNGIGIPQEAREKIFKMFQRLHSESEYPGTGIGLAIVRKAMQRMGGEMGVESQLGKGSRFWLEMKTAERKAQTPAPENIMA